jgi:glycosyltransferase involved in cell wall biosynthesis
MAYSGDKPTTSVLLPTYNRAGLIADAIDSLLAQTTLPSEIIILDDGSSDATAEVCASYGHKLTYVALSANGGKSAAINRGLAMAQGDFVWIMDDDDIAPPHALSALLAPLIADDTLGFSYGALQKFRTGKRGERIFERVAAQRSNAPLSLFVNLMEDCFITGQPCVLFRRNILNDLAPFDETVLSSVDYNILLEVARRSLQKAVIAARKELWAEAVRCICVGLSIRPEEPLSPEGASILSRMFGSRYGIDAFLEETSTQKALAAAFAQSELGGQAGMAVCAQLPFWFQYSLRRGRLVAACRILAVLRRLVGRVGAFQVMRGAIERKLGRGKLAGVSAAKTANATYPAHKW